MWYYVHDDYDVYNEWNDTDAEEMKETQERSWMRMNRIILASHGGLSAGMKDTVQMILGELPNLYALATLRDETEPITVAASQATTLGLVLVFILPAAVLVAGAVVVLLRRRR